MRLLVTDGLDPRVPAMVEALQRTTAGPPAGPPWTVLGLVSGPVDRHAMVPPPGVAELLAVRATDDEALWVGRVLILAWRRRVDAVLPRGDTAVRLLGSAAAGFAAYGISVVAPPPDLVELAADRWTAWQRLAELGLAAPARLVGTGAELETAARELGYPGRRLAVSRRRAADGDRTWLLSHDTAPWGATPPPGLTALPLPAAAATAAACRRLPELVMQQVTAGTDYTVDALCADGVVLGAVARIRSAPAAGFGLERTVGPLPPPVAAAVRQLAAALRWSQLLTARIRWSPVTGEVAVTRLDAGASRSIGMAERVGVPLLSAAVDLAATGRAPVLPEPGPAVRIRPYLREQTWPV